MAGIRPAAELLHFAMLKANCRQQDSQKNTEQIRQIVARDNKGI